MTDGDTGQTKACYTQARAGNTQVQAGHHTHEKFHLATFQELNRRQKQNWFLAKVFKRKQNTETNNEDQETDSEPDWT